MIVELASLVGLFLDAIISMDGIIKPFKCRLHTMPVNILLKNTFFPCGLTYDTIESLVNVSIFKTRPAEFHLENETNMRL